MAKEHGIFIYEEATALTIPKKSSAGLQVVIGTAPVNMVENPESVVNVPVLAMSSAEAQKNLGYSMNFKEFTLCQSMYITANVCIVSPVIYINVLDPAKHKKDLEAQTVKVDEYQATVEIEGILKKNLVVTAGETELKENEDYTLAFDTDGYLVVTLVTSGKGASATELTVSGKMLDTAAVDKYDIIGAYDISTGKETGMEVIRQIFPKLSMVPGILLAPGWSHEPEVGIALCAKAANINGVFRAVAFLDLDTEKAKKYTDVKEVKEKSGFTSELCYILWPCFMVGELIFSASAVVAARLAYLDAENEDIPSKSPSNKQTPITGTCLADGTEIVLDQDQGTVVNSFGVATAINRNGFRPWGSYTGAWPASGDAKDVWLNVRRMFIWQGNTFILTYFDKVDDNMNRALIDNIIDSENIRCAAYAPQHWAGASIEYLAEDNPATSILAGEMKFRQHIAPYTPAQTINNVLNYDIDTLTSALTEG